MSLCMASVAEVSSDQLGSIAQQHFFNAAVAWAWKSSHATGSAGVFCAALQVKAGTWESGHEKRATHHMQLSHIVSLTCPIAAPWHRQ